jgi:hypothetical protein
MVGKSPYDWQLKEEFQKHRLFGRNLILQIKVLRIDADQFIIQFRIVVTGHDDKRNGFSCHDDGCLLANYVFDKVADQLFINIAGVGHGRFVRQSVSQQINGIDLMFIGEIIDQSVVFVIGTSYSQIMYEEKRGAASFLLVSDLTEAPFIVAVF